MEVHLDSYSDNNLPGSAPILEQLFKDLYSRLVYFCYQLIGDKENAEDLVQEAFVTYWNLKEEIAPDKIAIKSFLYTTVRNASFNFKRHNKVVKGYLEKHNVSISDEQTIMHSMIRSEVLAELYEAINTLPESCRKISHMSFLQSKKNQEIANELGISINTVKTQKQRALQLLRLRVSPDIFTVLLLLMQASSL